MPCAQSCRKGRSRGPSLRKQTAQEQNTAAEASIEAEDILEEDALDDEPDVVDAGDGLDDDKLESGLSEDSDDEDLLEGIPEEELKATVDVQLPKVAGKSKVRSVRKRNADASVTMLTGDPVRNNVLEGDRQGSAAHCGGGDRPRHEDRRVAATEELEKAEDEGTELERREKRRLGRIEQVGIDAKQQLIEANLRLVVHCQALRGPRHAVPRPHPRGQPRLIRAVEKFDYTKGFQVLDVRHLRIRQPSRAIADQARTIRHPRAHGGDHQQARAHPAPAFMELGRYSSPRRSARRWASCRACAIQKISQEPVSLKRLSARRRTQLGDFIEDDAVVPPDAASFSMPQAAVEGAFDGLAERERKVISLRFGLKTAIRTSRRSDASPRHARENHRSRARRWQSRHPSRLSKLKDYLED